MSYGVALRNGVPFTLGTIAALCVNATTQWNPLALWPDGIATPGMWISPRTLTSEWQDYTGTTPVATPGTVADASNPVGLALDIRAGAPEVLGPELITNGDFSDGATDWVGWTNIVDGKAVFDGIHGDLVQPSATFVIGQMYLVSWYQSEAYVYYRLGGGNLGYMFGAGQKTVYAIATGTSSFTLAQGGMTPGVGYIDNISVREVPGLHMLQSTSAARPLLSARVNTLTYTEDFSNAVWVTDLWGDATITKTVGQTDPLGDATAVRLLVTASVGNAAFRYTEGLATEQVIRSAYIKSNTGVGYSMSLGDTAITLDADTEWHRYDVSEPVFSWGFRVQFTASADVTLAFPMRERGTILTDYQSVPGDGSTYATDFPIAQKYDGVDDGMATAAFSAGTLTAGMDCMIVVRRDSAGACVAGLYNGVADATKFFGMAESGSGSGCVGSGAGTPTVWVDGTQLAGGTAVTRGTLHTALTVGDVHILEFRGLDLSTWASSGFGLYTSYLFTGPRGDILLYPSTDPTEDKDAARQWLADYYGVTLA
jgi:hypothetical protein